MTATQLSTSERRLLLSCRRVAEENHVFYETVYKTMRDDQDKAILGQAMAGKKAFIDAIETIDHALEIDSHVICNNKLSRPQEGFPPVSEDPNHRENKSFWPMIAAHEDRFNEALDMALSDIEDQTTRDVLEHHKHAGKIARAAISEAEVRPVKTL